MDQDTTVSKKEHKFEKDKWNCGKHFYSPTMSQYFSKTLFSAFAAAGVLWYSYMHILRPKRFHILVCKIA